MVETLDAVIRMKNGSIDLSGSADLGFADVAGNGYKETLDGVYVEGGVSGGNVFADDQGPYDLTSPHPRCDFPGVRGPSYR